MNTEERTSWRDDPKIKAVFDRAMEKNPEVTKKAATALDAIEEVRQRVAAGSPLEPQDLLRLERLVREGEVLVEREREKARRRVWQAAFFYSSIAVIAACFALLLTIAAATTPVLGWKVVYIGIAAMDAAIFARFLPIASRAISALVRR